ncbi:HAD-IA family hydrolase [Jiella sp. MQZ9-1]|uniref:phosphoglycolate phosphatase n=1 Tax=Jiella flava TaxID=2816857 RepID=A0A939FXQ8_9HYPH|nr:HAD-IA family hydrolase [Jiella flava]MBO0663417.1 HAD-IA family hydrolase [Jiella flava]MCD2471993.1 HAD-IA family hydrolase [Jiella flava]
MPSPTAATIIFDLDGTLIDTAPDLAAALNYCLGEAGHGTDALAVVRPEAGHGARAMLTAAYARRGVPLDEPMMLAALDRFLGYYEAHIADASRPYPGVVTAMDALTEAGFELAVCTNKRERLATVLLDQLGLSARFATICGADTVAHRKPHPDHIRETLGRAGGSVAAGAIMIGDSAADIDAADAAGIPSILVDFGYAPEADARAKASITLADYRDLTPKLAWRLLAHRP